MLAPKHARLLSFVFTLAILPLLGLYALLMKISTPSPEGGMEPTVTMICYFAWTIIFSALIIVSWNFSRQLAREAKGQFQTP
ncbi:MAG TPA: hypothetical protein VE869_09790 [Gemmatimonas sp.]|nr:hypothetical protein [Gemmatimonas sp.]HYW31786.1 hypothetical protein [Gemmatimonas sp.]